MATEIERKFLVTGDEWQAETDSSSHLVQGYLSRGSERSVRVRTKGNNKAFLNIKSSTTGITRTEFEYEIPLKDANEILENIALQPVIDKTRYLVKKGAHTWEIDVFERENKGLVIAEIELSSEDEDFEKPAWIGKEVSDDPSFYNMNIESQDWRRSYPEELLLKFGGSVHDSIKYEPEGMNDCQDGC